MGHFAFVTLALAELYVEESNAKSALKLISEIIPILETFAVHRGVLTAIRLLRAAERDDTISLELLAEINKCLTPIQGRLLARRSAE